LRQAAQVVLCEAHHRLGNKRNGGTCLVEVIEGFEDRLTREVFAEQQEYLNVGKISDIMFTTKEPLNLPNQPSVHVVWWSIGKVSNKQRIPHDTYRLFDIVNQDLNSFATSRNLYVAKVKNQPVGYLIEPNMRLSDYTPIGEKETTFYQGLTMATKQKDVKRVLTFLQQVLKAKRYLLLSIKVDDVNIDCDKLEKLVVNKAKVADTMELLLVGVAWNANIWVVQEGEPTKLLFKLPGAWTNVVVEQSTRHTMILRPKQRRLRTSQDPRLDFAMLSNLFELNLPYTRTIGSKSMHDMRNKLKTVCSAKADQDLAVDFAKSTYTIVNFKAVKLFADILKARKVVKHVGIDDIKSFVRRLVYNRPITFVGECDAYMLRDQGKLTKQTCDNNKFTEESAPQGTNSYKDIQLAA
jgi:hypothetical protein